MDFGCILKFLGDMEIVIPSVMALISIYYVAKFVKFIASGLAKESALEIKELENNGKFIKKLYAEIDSTQEELRYFLFQEKWKGRVVAEVNRLFSTGYSDDLRKFCNNDFRVLHSDSYQVIKERLSDYISMFKGEKYPKSFFEGKGDLYYYMTDGSYFLRKNVEKVLKLCESATSKSIMIVGTAGNGKTNLLCSFADLVMRNGNLCMFIEARKVRGDCTDFFNRKLKTIWGFPKEVSYIILDSYLNIFRKKMFVVIDAINENDDDGFAGSLHNLNSLLLKMKNVRVLYSCRSELLEERLKKFFPSSFDSFLLEVGTMRSNNNALEYMFLRYRDFFDYSGRVSRAVLKRLYEHLILLRIFFEAYSNSSVNVDDFYNAQIYTLYLRKIFDSYPAYADKVLNCIISTMIKNSEYNDVELLALDFVSDEKDCCMSMIDNHLLLSRKLVKDSGRLTEQIRDVVYFPFDELRDYCIARYCLIKCDESSDYTSFFDLADALILKNSSPAEGVIKFSYFYFRDKRQFEICDELLTRYGDACCQQERSGQSVFSCLGLSILVNCLHELNEFEKEFIRMKSLLHGRDFMLIIGTLLDNEIDGVDPGIGLVFDLFTGESVEIEIQSRMTYDWRIIENSLKILFDMNKYKTKEFTPSMRRFFKLLKNVYG